MKITLVGEFTERVRVVKAFKIKVGRTELQLYKWEDSDGDDNDWEWATKEFEDKYKKLPEEVQDEVYDFILELPMGITNS